MSFDHTIKKGTTSKIIEIMLRDSSTGQGKTGLATGSMSGAYVREGSTHVSLSFVGASAGDAYSSGRWAEVDATNMAGVYQYHLPDLALASGVDAVTFRFSATGVIDKVVRISLINVDLRNASNAGLSDVSAILVDTNTTIPASISALNDFDPAADTVTVSQNNDKTGYSISGTKTTLDQLNDIAATSIVSSGAINTSSGAVSTVNNVVLCDTTTTNSDMRGTDSALLASSVPANFAAMLITAGGTITVGTNNDKVNYSISGTKTTLDDLNDLDAASVNSEVDTALSDIGLDHLVSASVAGADVADNSIVAKMVSKNATADWDTFTNTDDSLEAIRDRGDSSWTPSGGLTAADIADAVLDEALSGHVNNGSLGKAIADIETDATAILEDTETTIPASITIIDTEIGDIQSDVTSISNDTTILRTNLNTLDGKVVTIDSNVDSILEDTQTTIPATLALLSTLDAAGVRTAVGLATNNLDTQLGTIDSNVDSILEDTETTIPATLALLSTLDAAGVRSAVGLATNNLDTQLTTIDGNVDAILVDTETTIPDQISALPNAAAIADAVWDESLSQHNSGGTTGKALKQIKEGTITIESSINDASATTTSFVTDLTEPTTSYYSNKIMVFIDGHLSGQARIITNYNGTTKTITLEEPLTSAPADGDQFLILATHENSVAEIADGVWNETRAGHTTVGTFGYYLDARVSQAGGGGGGASAADIWGALLTDYATAGTFGARFQEAERYTNTTANIIYVNQGDAYDDTANNAIAWEVSKDYSGADSLTLVIEHRVTGAVLLSHAVTYIDATTLKAYLSSSDTAFSTLTTDADFGVHPYRVEADYSGEVQSAVRGAVTIRQS